MTFNMDATWCTNESCSEKTKCWRWMGYFEGEFLDPQLVRHYDGGPDCEHMISTDTGRKERK